MTFDRAQYSDSDLLDLYRQLVLPRMIEERMLTLLRQGRISKWFSGIGQEAISVGAASALTGNDWILPLHRNLGVFTVRGLPLPKLFAQWQGKQSGYTQGRDRSFHFGTAEHRIVGMISHLGAMLGVADGIALASNVDGSDDIALVFSGDGGASEGDFHEAINVAAVWNLPVIFLVENNGYGLSTPSRQQFAFKQFVDKAIGYGIEGVQVDGNNVLAVHQAVTRIATKMRVDRRPVLLEAMTFRMRGHEEASGTAYVPKSEFAEWKKKDPIDTYQSYLLQQRILTNELVASIRDAHSANIEHAVDEMLRDETLVLDPKIELRDVYAPARTEQIAPSTGKQTERRFVDAISDGLRQGMQRDEKLIIMGQDIAEYGGVFKVTEGFLQEFGADRVRNTPLCESAIIGASLGLSICRHPSVVEMQFADFVACGFNQIVNNLAKTHYRWGQQVNVTVRMPTGAGVAAGPFHSQSDEAWFTHLPGVKVVYPSNPFDAKGLLTSSLREPNPVLYFEHKYLYRSTRAMVPDEYYTLPLGEAKIARAGTRATIVTYGLGVHWALQYCDDTGDDIEVIDLRTLLPWDRETVRASVRRTGRCLVLHEDTQTGGFGGEIAAAIAEDSFSYLDAPVMRIGSMDTPVPFNAQLEKQFLPVQQLHAKVRALLDW